MILKSWIQMGVERRETVIEIPESEVSAVAEKAREDGACLETRLEDYVRDWMYVQYGWGWSGGGFTNDFGFMERNTDGGYGALVVTSESSIPNTEAVKLCPCCRQPLIGTEHAVTEEA